MTDSERDQWRGAIDGRISRVEQDLSHLSREVAILQADTGHIATELESVGKELALLGAKVSEWRGALAALKWLAGLSIGISSVGVALLVALLERM